MRAHVLLSLLNELGKRDQMRGLSEILSFHFHKFNNTCITAGLHTGLRIQLPCDQSYTRSARRCL